MPPRPTTLNIAINTEPTAIAFVKYGKKNNVWYSLLNQVILFNQTEINNAINNDNGTEINANIKVLNKAFVKFGHCKTFTKFSIPIPLSFPVKAE